MTTPDQTTDFDPLATLGQRVLKVVTEAYDPSNQAKVALAMHPGQLVGTDFGSEWLEQYDHPLLLKLADGTPVASSISGEVSAKSAYVASIPFAVPTFAADDLAWSRMAALIQDARKDLGGNPDALPLGTEPDDQERADVAAWHLFDEVIETSSSTTTTTTPNAPRVNPELWKFRALTPALETRIPLLEVPQPQPDPPVHIAGPTPIREGTIQMGRLGRVSPLDTALRADTVKESVQMQAVASPRTFGSASLRTNLIGAESVTSARVTAPWLATINLDVTAAMRERPISLGDLTEAPPSTSTVTVTKSLHVHFEFCLVAITRKLAGTPWWHPELLASDDWYVPGVGKGELIPEADEVGYAYCLPQALILVRNVQFTGEWTADALATVSGSGAFFGPFLLEPPSVKDSETAASTQLTVLGLGTQVIGELCTPLAPMPPANEPAVALADDSGSNPADSPIT